MLISINQKSGLGNQLFQYAAGEFFAQKYAAQLEIVRDPAHLANSHGYPRPFLLSEFQIEAPVRERSGLDRLLCSEKAKTLPLARAARAVTRTQVYREPIGTQWLFQPDLPIAHPRHLYIEGYWQSYRFAETGETTLRRHLEFRHAPEGKTAALLDRIHATPYPVSLHIRRGDYTLAAEGSPALPMTYYSNALAAVLTRVGNPTYFVFSDDIAFARANLPGADRMIFVDHNDDHTAHDDLRLMSACRHHIIANSSFSWWGAWLNPDPQKLVIAPDRWTDPTLPATDLIPPAWQRVSATH